MRTGRWAVQFLICIACSGSLSAATYTVEILPNSSFSPAELTIAQGDTVKWVWMDFRPQHHAHCPTGELGLRDPRARPSVQSCVPDRRCVPVRLHAPRAAHER